MPIKKLLIANRGEIAVRIIHAARDLGISTVQVMSKADHDMLAVKLADQAIEIGPAQAAKSYLNIDAILSAATISGADAIHPGYGFLSENAGFAEAVEAAGLIFVGPRGETIRQMGDKAIARSVAERAGVPTVPGSDGRVSGISEARKLASGIGFPIMIKAAAGGGGRGIRVARSPDDLEKLIPLARAEASAAFADGGLYLERFIERARHIEVQILGDGERAVHVYERECSIQRRRQKVWEEAPAACLDADVRERLCASAGALARSVGYRGAGTLEYLYDEETGEFFFMEMNTRIQVEHPVSEMITGIDLVKEMIRVAAGEPLSFDQDDVRVRGHAIECRINAENTANGFMPSPGTITSLAVPRGPHVRFDTMLYEGYVVPPFYDSLLGKLVVWGENRDAARERMVAALGDLKVEGVDTTVALHMALANDPEVVAHKVHTRWLEAWLDQHSLSQLPKMRSRDGDADEVLIRG